MSYSVRMEVFVLKKISADGFVISLCLPLAEANGKE